MSENKSPIIQLIDGLENPEAILNDDQKKQLRTITSDVGSAVKTSLINLFMERFNKIAVYDGAIQTILQQLIAKSEGMDSMELINLLSVLTKTSSTDSKSVMDMFKKNGNDFNELVRELQKMNSSKEETSQEQSQLDSSSQPIMDLPQEKIDKILRFMEKIDKKKGPKADIIDVKAETLEDDKS